MNGLHKLIKFFTDERFRFNILSSRGLYNHWPDEKYLKHKFKLALGYELNLDNPQTFCEKLQWLKLYDRNPLYTTMVDKYKVKKYVAEIIGSEYIIPTLGVWEDPDEIDFDKLPNQFVLKCNHNSGRGMCICKDKTKLDIKKVKKELSKGLKQDYYLTGREWPYKNVPRKIIAEKYLQDETCGDLKDYKVMCFAGEPKLIELHRYRFTDSHIQEFYDTTWKKTSISQTGTAKFKVSNTVCPRPSSLDIILELSKKLANGLKHIRVDWYCVNGKVYFGELTFFDGSGLVPFDNFQDDLYLGSLIRIP